MTAFGLFSAEHQYDPARPVLSQYSSSSYPRLEDDQPKLNRSNQNFYFLSVGAIPIMKSFHVNYDHHSGSVYFSPRNNGISRSHFTVGIDKLPFVGIGLSRRREGKATDAYIRSSLFANTLSYTVSKIFYKSSIDKGSYCSIGAGGFVGDIVSMPFAGVAIPLRAGFEGKKGFVDLGLELEGGNLVFLSVTPELRAGTQF